MYSFEVDSTINTDLVVVGAGAAGIRSCYEAAKNGVNDIVIVSKGKILNSGSSFFSLVHGWGMQAVVPGLNNDDSKEKYYNEIIDRGLGMTDTNLVKVLVEEAYSRVKDLQELGLQFKERNGQLEQIIGCFSREKRALSAVDMKNIRDTFHRMLLSSKAKIFENFMVLDFIIRDKIFLGLVGITSDGRFIRINAKACILATGGGANVYKHSLNSGESSGDTYGLALRAGLGLYNMEFIQFIFGIVFPKRLIFSERSLYYSPDILNGKGERFIERYLPPGVNYDLVLGERIVHGPFSARTVSRYFDIAIFKEIRNGDGSEHGGVMVDLRNYWDIKERDVLLNRWTDVTDVWINWLKDEHHIDISKELLEIDHAAHAFNGGIEADETTRSKIPNLFVCGEALAGPHGADRLGGNMMTSTQVFGTRAGYYAALEVRSFREGVLNRNGGSIFKVQDLFPFPVSGKGERNYLELREKLKEKMWLYGHVVRDGAGLLRLKEELEKIRENITFLAVKDAFDIRKKYELLNLVTLASVITLASLERKESRGSFYREDFPNMDSIFSRKIKVFSTTEKLGVEYIDEKEN